MSRFPPLNSTRRIKTISTMDVPGDKEHFYFVVNKLLFFLDYNVITM
jgi:hypothetical protein